MDRACDSVDALIERLAEDGVIYDDDDLLVALARLETNGTGDYDGRLPGLPYRILRPEPKSQPSRLNPHPPRRSCTSDCGRVENQNSRTIVRSFRQVRVRNTRASERVAPC
jgi:hypothetical protein